jgi:hypothetical protein
MQSGTSTGRHSGTRFPEVCCRKDTKPGTAIGGILRFVKKELISQPLSASGKLRRGITSPVTGRDCAVLRATRKGRSERDWIWGLGGRFEPGMAEKMGFEPTIPSRVYSLSRGAPSTTRPPLRSGLIIGKRYRWQGLLWKCHAIPTGHDTRIATSDSIPVASVILSSPNAACRRRRHGRNGRPAIAAPRKIR